MEIMEAELIRLIPSIFWFLLLVVLIRVCYRPIQDDLLPNLMGLRAAGVELSFIKDSIDAAIELAEKFPKWKVEIPSIDKERALKRARQHLKVFREAQLLWVDDHPEYNLNERSMFRQLGAEIDVAKCSEESLAMLKDHGYDVIISDVARGNESSAGLKFLEEFRKQNKTTPVISRSVRFCLRKAFRLAPSALPIDPTHCFT